MTILIVILVLVFFSICTLLIIRQIPTEPTPTNATSLNSADPFFYGNLTVLGNVNSQLLCKPYQSSLLSIRFTDTQTGAQVAYDFPSYFPQLGPSGNYTVALMREHTYNVTVDYYRGSSDGQFYHATDSVGTFTVHSLGGEAVVRKDFP